MHHRLIYLFILTCIATPNFFSSVLTSEMFRKCFKPRWEFLKSSEWTPGRGRIVWAQMDGAAVSNMGPSGGGLTCLPTYHSLMPIDKWVVRCWLWLRRGCRQGNWDGTSCSDTEPESLLLSAAGEASVKRYEGRREFGLGAWKDLHKKIYGKLKILIAWTVGLLNQ